MGDGERVKGREMDGGLRDAPELELGGEYEMDGNEVGGAAAAGCDGGRIGADGWLKVLELTVDTLSPAVCPVLILLLSREGENWKPRRRELELITEDDDVSADDNELRSWTFAVVGEEVAANVVVAIVVSMSNPK